MPVFTRRNLGRATRLWSWVAILGAPFVLLMGVLLIAGSSSAGPTAVEMWRTAPAGEPLELPRSGRAAAVWGQPATGAAGDVRCTTARSDGSDEMALDAPPDGAPTTAEDAGVTGTWLRLGSTSASRPAATVMCSGAGLRLVAVSADLPPRDGSAFGWLLVLMSPLLVGLGLLARRAGRSAALAGPTKDGPDGDTGGPSSTPLHP